MTMNKTPLDAVRGEYGSKDDRGKDKLVDKVVGLISGGDEDAATLRERLMKVSNKKLLRLAEVGGTIKAKYGSTDKVAEAVAEAVGRAKDADYVTSLKAYSPGRLLDMAQALGRRAAAKAKTVAPKAEGAVKKVAKAAKAAAGKAGAKATKTVSKAVKTVKAAAGKATKTASKATKSKK